MDNILHISLLACGFGACHALLGSDVTQAAGRLAGAAPHRPTQTHFKKHTHLHTHSRVLMIKQAAYIYIHTHTTHDSTLSEVVNNLKFSFGAVTAFHKHWTGDSYSLLVFFFSSILTSPPSTLMGIDFL